MTPADLSSKQNWEKKHNCLYRALKKEVALMRELLANLHEEELCLLERDPRRWYKVMNDRSELVMQVMQKRNERIEATTGLEKLAAQLSLKEILPAEEERSCEVLSQIDQLFALIDRMNLQNCRNDALFLQAKEQQSMPLYCSYPHPLHQQEKKPRKTAIATDSRKNP